MTISTQQALWLGLGARVSGTIGLLGALGVIYLILREKRELSKAASRLVFAIAISDVLEALKSIVGRMGPDAGAQSALCQAQATVVQVAALTDCFYCLIMSIFILHLIFSKSVLDKVFSFEIIAVYASTSVAVTVGVVPLFVTPRIYGAGPVWCWITLKYSMWQLLLCYVFIWAIMVFNFIAYAVTNKKMKEMAAYFEPKHVDSVSGLKITAISSGCSNATVAQPPASPTTPSSAPPLSATYLVSTQNFDASASGDIERGSLATIPRRPIDHVDRRRMTTNVLRRMRFFVLSFLIMWLPGSVNRMYTIATGDANFNLNMLHGTIQPLRGMTNCIAFIANMYYQRGSLRA
ncbi:hypothetical protein HK101_003626, partial [Irineochytrium annulatum]